MHSGITSRFTNMPINQVRLVDHVVLLNRFYETVQNQSV